MTTTTQRRKNDCALNILISSELKTALNDAARTYGVNVADLVRVSVRAMLPVLAAMASSQDIIVNELIGHLGGSMRKRHDILDSIDENHVSKQGRGPC